jgi:hypothetical protein
VSQYETELPTKDSITNSSMNFGYVQLKDCKAKPSVVTEKWANIENFGKS